MIHRNPVFMIHLGVTKNHVGARRKNKCPSFDIQTKRGNINGKKDRL